MAAKPGLLLFDDPTTGLDPITATTVDDESKSASADFIVLREGRIHFQGTTAELLASSDPYLKTFLLMALPPW